MPLVGVKYVGRNDDVGDAGFVFERQKHKSFRRAGPLANDHRAGHAHAAPGPLARQIARAQHAARGERRPRTSAIGCGRSSAPCRRSRPYAMRTGTWREGETGAGPEQPAAASGIEAGADGAGSIFSSISSGPAGRAARSACQSASTVDRQMTRARRFPRACAIRPDETGVATTRSSRDRNRAAQDRALRACGPDRSRSSILLPASSLSPFTYINPSRTRPSS